MTELEINNIRASIKELTTKMDALEQANAVLKDKIQDLELHILTLKHTTMKLGERTWDSIRYG